MNTRQALDQSKIGSHDYLLGLDEVGWGCIAGELVLGAAIISKDFFDLQKKLDPKIADMVRDSKKLSEGKRKEIFAYFNSQSAISQDHLKIVLGRASVEEINTLGLAKAFDLCVQRILEHTPKNTLILLDGKRVPDALKNQSVELIIKGDDASWAIGLASVMAKTSRDQSLEDLHFQYPQYGFMDHKGYGTSSHVAALKAHGLSPVHRIKSSTTILS